ncbi:MAG: hypothetical protein EXS22_03335 [Pedosphaera sp.]|nr:hypothetical protein [Pedosphaera sp.]MSU43058.1 hypothetical protein [Pedosphaera sp.]
MRPWNPILAALAIFGAGATTGYFLARQPVANPSQPAAVQSAKAPVQPFLTQLSVADLDVRLSLSYDQEKQVQIIYDESHERMRLFLEPTRQRMHEEQRRLNEAIHAVLTADQAKRFEKLPWHRFGRSPGQPPQKSNPPHQPDPFPGKKAGDANASLPLPSPSNGTVIQ